MKKTLFFLLSGLILAAMACTTKTAVVNNDALVDSLLSDCAAAWNSGIPETTANFYAEDAIIIFQDDIYSGRDSILAFCKNVVPFMKNVKVNRGIYAVADDIITGVGMYTFDWVGEDQIPYPIRGSGTLHWQKVADNTWKIVLQINQQANIVVK